MQQVQTIIYLNIFLVKIKNFRKKINKFVMRLTKLIQIKVDLLKSMS